MMGAASFAMAARAAAQPVTSKRLALVNVSAPSQAQMHEDRSAYYKTFLGELRRLGRVEGQDLIVDRYSKEQLVSGPAALAAQVVTSKPDVINLIDPSPVFFAPETKTIPIVTIQNDPVAFGFAQSMARPGGNITGVSVDAGPSIHGKRIALLREVVPGMSKLACITPGVAWGGPLGVAVRGGPKMRAFRSSASRSTIPATRRPIATPSFRPPAMARMRSWLSTVRMRSRTVSRYMKLSRSVVCRVFQDLLPEVICAA
jgi:putative ABC transport system substrate-binding protein